MRIIIVFIVTMHVYINLADFLYNLVNKLMPMAAYFMHACYHT